MGDVAAWLRWPQLRRLPEGEDKRDACRLTVLVFEQTSDDLAGLTLADVSTIGVQPQPPNTTLFMIRPGASVNKPVTTSARVKIQIIATR
jgi:hypothetical protein